MLVVAHLRADGERQNWVGHVAFAEDSPPPNQIALAVIELIGSSMSVIEGDLIRVFHATDRN